MSMSLRVLVLVCVALGISCATVRVVKKKKTGGIIAVQSGLFESYDAKANAAMTSNCRGKGYEVVEEGEEVVGSSTHGSEQNRKNGKKAFFDSTTSTSSSTMQVTEWRITYKCNGSGKKKRMSILLPSATQTH